MIIVKISATAVGKAPMPAPLATCPKNITHETIDQTNQVYACGSILFLYTSIRYGTLPTTANTDAIIANDHFIIYIIAL